MTYDALMFLTKLFSENPPADALVDGEPETTVEDLPIDWRLLWDERAAIMEFDGGLTRERAEAEALKDIIRMMRRQDALNNSTKEKLRQSGEGP